MFQSAARYLGGAPALLGAGRFALGAALDAAEVHATGAAGATQAVASIASGQIRRALLPDALMSREKSVGRAVSALDWRTALAALFVLVKMPKRAESLAGQLFGLFAAAHEVERIVDAFYRHGEARTVLCAVCWSRLIQIASHFVLAALFATSQTQSFDAEFLTVGSRVQFTIPYDFVVRDLVLCLVVAALRAAGAPSWKVHASALGLELTSRTFQLFTGFSLWAVYARSLESSLLGVKGALIRQD